MTLDKLLDEWACCMADIRVEMTLGTAAEIKAAILRAEKAKEAIHGYVKEITTKGLTVESN